MEVGQGPNWGCSAKEKNQTYILENDPEQKCLDKLKYIST
jgi:hypothetical protein